MKSTHYPKSGLINFELGGGALPPYPPGGDKEVEKCRSRCFSGVTDGGHGLNVRTVEGATGANIIKNPERFIWRGGVQPGG